MTTPSGADATGPGATGPDATGSGTAESAAALPDGQEVEPAVEEDIHAVPGRLLDEITEMVETARAMPMSASCVVNRAELLSMLDELREKMPAALARADELLADRDAVVDDGRSEADELVAQAKKERARLLAQHDIVVHAQEEGARILEEARYQADVMRQEVEDYVDAKLANFEIVLNKTLSAVARGRDKLSGHSELEALGDSLDERPLPG